MNQNLAKDILAAIEKYDFEYSTDKDALETLEGVVKDLEGSHLVIRMLLGFLEQQEEEHNSIIQKLERDLYEYEGGF